MAPDEQKTTTPTPQSFQQLLAQFKNSTKDACEAQKKYLNQEAFPKTCAALQALIDELITDANHSQSEKITYAGMHVRYNTLYETAHNESTSKLTGLAPYNPFSSDYGPLTGFLNLLNGMRSEMYSQAKFATAERRDTVLAEKAQAEAKDITKRLATLETRTAAAGPNATPSAEDSEALRELKARLEKLEQPMAAASVGADGTAELQRRLQQLEEQLSSKDDVLAQLRALKAEREKEKEEQARKEKENDSRYRDIERKLGQLTAQVTALHSRAPSPQKATRGPSSFFVETADHTFAGQREKAAPWTTKARLFVFDDLRDSYKAENDKAIQRQIQELTWLLVNDRQRSAKIIVEEFKRQLASAKTAASAATDDTGFASYLDSLASKIPDDDLQTLGSWSTKEYFTIFFKQLSRGGYLPRINTLAQQCADIAEIRTGEVQVRTNGGRK